MCTIWLTLGKELVLWDWPDALSVNTVCDPDQSFALHARGGGDPCRYVHPSHAEKTRVIFAAAGEAQEQGLLESVHGVKGRLVLCQLQHDIDGLQPASVCFPLTVAHNVVLEPDKIRYGAHLPQHDGHAVIVDVHSGEECLPDQGVQLIYTNVFELL